MFDFIPDSNQPIVVSLLEIRFGHRTVKITSCLLIDWLFGHKLLAKFIPTFQSHCVFNAHWQPIRQLILRRSIQCGKISWRKIFGVVGWGTYKLIQSANAHWDLMWAQDRIRLSTTVVVSIKVSSFTAPVDQDVIVTTLITNQSTK